MLNNELIQAMLYIEHEICCNKYNDSIFLNDMSNWVKFWAIIKKELDYDITLHPKFLLGSHDYMPYSCYHTYAHQALHARKCNATIIVFSHAYDLEG